LQFLEPLVFVSALLVQYTCDFGICLPELLMFVDTLFLCGCDAWPDGYVVQRNLIDSGFVGFHY
jgi:hypothetical protein